MRRPKHPSGVGALVDLEEERRGVSESNGDIPATRLADARFIQSATPKLFAGRASFRRVAEALVQVYLGLVFVNAGVQRLIRTGGNPGSWPAMLAQYRSAFHLTVWPFYRQILDSLATHSAVVGWLQAIGNVAVGVVLVAWIAPCRWTAVAASVALFLLLNLMAASGTVPWSPGPPAAFGALAATVLLIALSTQRPWTLLRTYVGLCFFLPVFHRIAHPDQWLLEVRRFLDVYAPHATSWYRPLLTGVVARHVSILATLVAVGEGLVGSLFLTGLYTRFAALLGVFLSLNYWLAKADPVLAASNDHAFVIGMIGLALVSPALRFRPRFEWV